MSRTDIEKKYERLIGATIKRMKNKSMAELWQELDKLKANMKEDFERAGIKLESQ